MSIIENLGRAQPTISIWLDHFIRYCEILALAIFFHAAARATQSLLIDVLAIALYAASMGYLGYAGGTLVSGFLSGVSATSKRKSVLVFFLWGGLLIISGIAGYTVENAIAAATIAQLK